MVVLVLSLTPPTGSYRTSQSRPPAVCDESFTSSLVNSVVPLAELAEATDVDDVRATGRTTVDLHVFSPASYHVIICNNGLCYVAANGLFSWTEVKIGLIEVRGFNMCKPH